MKRSGWFVKPSPEELKGIPTEYLEQGEENQDDDDDDDDEEHEKEQDYAEEAEWQEEPEWEEDAMNTDETAGDDNLEEDAADEGVEEEEEEEEQQEEEEEHIESETHVWTQRAPQVRPTIVPGGCARRGVRVGCVVPSKQTTTTMGTSRSSSLAMTAAQLYHQKVSKKMPLPAKPLHQNSAASDFDADVFLSHTSRLQEDPPLSQGLEDAPTQHVPKVIMPQPGRPLHIKSRFKRDVPQEGIPAKAQAAPKATPIVPGGIKKMLAWQEAVHAEQVKAPALPIKVETEDKTEYFGYVRSRLEENKYLIRSQGISDNYNGKDAKITWKSSAPPNLLIGDWISFKVVPEYPGESRGSPIAVNIQAVPPQVEAPVPDLSNQRVKESALTQLKRKPGPAEDLPPSKRTAAMGKAKDVSTLLQEAQRADAEEPFQRKFINAPEMSPADCKAMQSIRKELEITVEGDETCAFPPVIEFEELHDVFPEYIVDKFIKKQLVTPTPLQTQAIPFLLSGKDVVGIANPEAGQHLATLLAAVVHIEAQDPLRQDIVAPIVVTLSPTKELAKKIFYDTKDWLDGSESGNHEQGIGMACAWGASANDWQSSGRPSCHILVATPVSLSVLLARGRVSLERVTYFVVYNLDRMISCRYAKQLQEVADAVRADRQTVIFSHVWSRELAEVALALCPSTEPPVRIAVGKVADSSIILPGKAAEHSSWATTAKSSVPDRPKPLVPGLVAKDRQSVTWVAPAAQVQLRDPAPGHPAAKRLSTPLQRAFGSGSLAQAAKARGTEDMVVKALGTFESALANLLNR